jgi:translation initiation factor IF-2
VKRDLVSDRGIEKTCIIVILGHFNHGKTTLLDALGNFTIVEKEVHGITQVINFTLIETVLSTYTLLKQRFDRLSLKYSCRTFPIL